MALKLSAKMTLDELECEKRRIEAELLGLSEPSVFGLSEPSVSALTFVTKMLQQDIARIASEIDHFPVFAANCARQALRKARGTFPENTEGARARIAARNLIIVEQRRSGLTLREIGAQHGIIPERVRQIVIRQDRREARAARVTESSARSL